MGQIHLIDSAAVLNNPAFSFISGNFITVPAVVDELKDLRSKALAENALRNNLLQLLEPSKESIEKIAALAKKHGFQRLSKADLSLLALAIDFKKQKKPFELVSDDYSVQNFCKLLRIKFDAVIRGKISKTISFKKACSACGKKFPGSVSSARCPDCGGKIKTTAA